MSSCCCNVISAWGATVPRSLPAPWQWPEGLWHAMSPATSQCGSVLGSVGEVELWCSGVFFPSVVSEEQKARACVHLSRKQMLWVLERSSTDSFGEIKCTFSFAQPEVQRISVICAFLEVAHLHWAPCLAHEILLMLSPEQGAGGQWCCCGCFWTKAHEGKQREAVARSDETDKQFL